MENQQFLTIIGIVIILAIVGLSIDFYQKERYNFDCLDTHYKYYCNDLNLTFETVALSLGNSLYYMCKSDATTLTSRIENKVLDYCKK